MSPPRAAPPPGRLLMRLGWALPATIAGAALAAHAGGNLPPAAVLPATAAIAALAAGGLGFGLLLQRHRRPPWRAELEWAGIGTAHWDLARRQARASPAWQRMAGPLEPDLTPADWLAHAHPLDLARLLPQLDELCGGARRTPIQAPLRLRPPGGDWHWYELHLQAGQWRRDGRARRLDALLYDINGRRVAEERQRMSVSLFQHVHEGLLVTDLQHRVLDANPSYCQLIGETREALAGRVAAPLEEAALRLSGHDPLQLTEALRGGGGGGSWEGLVQCHRADGQTCALQLSVSEIPEPDGPPRYRVVTVSDLTQQMRQQALLDRQQAFDALTGLPNQAEFRHRLDQALEASQREGFALCIACLDLDRFKQLNARLGRALGDRVLAQVALRLQGALRSGEEWSDGLARLGGDEFGLLLRCRDVEEAERALTRVLNVLRAPIHLEGVLEPLDLSASIGATLYPRDQSDGETLQRHASHALYRVKRSGRNGHEFFDIEKRARNDARVLALGRMQEALDAGELQLHYQPKVDMRRGRVLGAEALLRWHHPERGLLGPAHFLPVLEQTGLAVRVGDWVIEQALKQSAAWLAQGLALRVSVNVAARHLQADDFSQRLQELLARHPEPLAEHLMLEVLESTALADIEATQALIRRCRDLGVSFALDDFGTGYSTLTYLKRLPVDSLKIDRSFVQNMLIDAQDRALVEGVIGLARHFGCSVVAEGVETASHARALLAMGCDQGQGNGIAHPMPAAELADWVSQFQANPVLAGRQEAELGIH